MATVRDIYTCLDRKAPFSLQMDFDNSGFLVGRWEWEISRLLVALDITEEVVAEAAEQGAGLIVSHHPVIFNPSKSVTDSDPAGRRLLALIEHGIAAICAHTNLDCVTGGVNDALARALGLREPVLLHTDGIDSSGTPYGVGRIGTLAAPCTTAEFVSFVKTALGASGVRYADTGTPVFKVAVGGGACGSMLTEAAALGCDTFVTADVKYDMFLDAVSMGLNLLDAGHYPTENVVCPVLTAWLREAFPDVEVMQSGRHREITRYL